LASSIFPPHALLVPPRAARSRPRRRNIRSSRIRHRGKSRARLSPEEARRQALLRFGGPPQAKEHHREARSLPLLETLLQDLRFAFRTLLKSPGFTAVAVFTLALGIGTSTSIFSVVDAVPLRPLPYADPQQVMTVWELSAHGHRMHLADPNFLDFREQNRTFVGLAEFSSGPESVSGGGEPVRMNVAAISQGFFKVMGVEPVRGRDFAADELRLHGTPAMIVSYGYWQQYLGGRADFSNVRLTMEGQVYLIVGVMPQGFDFPPTVSAWVPREQLYEWTPSRTSHNGEVIEASSGRYFARTSPVGPEHHRTPDQEPVQQGGRRQQRLYAG
jgi:MacB-like periplasmic core domain